MKILVTGCAGFLGNFLTLKLLENGHSVTGIDNLNNYYDPELKLERLGRISSKNFKFVKLDINDIDNLNENFDLLINFAAQAGVRVSEAKQKFYVKTNINGFKKVLSFCEKNHIKKLLYASSSSVYSDSIIEPYSETTTDLSPKSTYGQTKLFNEFYVKNFNCSVDSVGLRFFSVYGPYGRPDMAYFSFTDSLKKGIPIKLHNKGEMMRDMTFIDDAINGIINSIDFLLKNKTKSEIFNIGNNSPIKTFEMLRIIEKKLGITANIKNINVENESKYTNADLDKSRRVIGYNPKVSFEEGITKFLDWHNKYESNEKG